MTNYRKLYESAERDLTAETMARSKLLISEAKLRDELKVKTQLAELQQEKIKAQEEYIEALVTLHQAEKNTIQRLTALVRHILPGAQI